MTSTRFQVFLVRARGVESSAVLEGPHACVTVLAPSGIVRRLSAQSAVYHAGACAILPSANAHLALLVVGVPDSGSVLEDVVGLS